MGVYAEIKEVIEVFLRMSADALHVHVGMILFLGAAALIRSRRRFAYALGCLLVLCLLGEVMDLSNAFAMGRRLRWAGSLKDIVNTMLWPTVCVVFGPTILRILRLNALGVELGLQKPERAPPGPAFPEAGPEAATAMALPGGMQRPQHAPAPKRSEGPGTGTCTSESRP